MMSLVPKMTLRKKGLTSTRNSDLKAIYYLLTEHRTFPPVSLHLWPSYATGYQKSIIDLFLLIQRGKRRTEGRKCTF